MVRRRSRGLFRSLTRGFTLIELLVVIAIILIATGLAMPSLGRFLKGRRLAQTGRLIQSEYNEARRAAVTEAARHYVFVGRIRSVGGIAPDVYALHILREGVGWDPGEPVQLPAGVVPAFDSGSPDVLRGCKLKVQDWTYGLPDPAQSGTVFDTVALKPLSSTPCHEFRKNGTIAVKNGAASVAVSDPDLYDLEKIPEPGTYGINTMTDMAFGQVGDPSKLLLLSIDLNTGRVRYRVVETEKVAGS